MNSTNCKFPDCEKSSALGAKEEQCFNQFKDTNSHVIWMGKTPEKVRRRDSVNVAQNVRFAETT